MYEQFKQEFLLHLSERTDLTDNMLQQVAQCLDVSMNGYNIERSSTELTVGDGNIPHLVKLYIVSKTVEGYSKETLKIYTRWLKYFFDEIKKDPVSAAANDLRLFLYNYKESRNISDASLDKVRSCISSFYKWMLDEGYINRNPMVSVKNIHCEKKQRCSISQTELEYMRKGCRTLKQSAILEFLYSTGCRVSEIIGVKKSDIDWSNNSVHLFGKGKKHRISFINAKAEVAIKDYLASRTDDNEYLFVSDKRPYNAMHRSGTERILKCITKVATEEYGLSKKVSPHIMRHTLATRLVESDVNISTVQRILGHSNVNTTMIYVHMPTESIQADHRKVVI